MYTEFLEMINHMLKPLRKLLIRSKERYTPFMTRYPGFTCYVIDKSSFLSMYEEIFENEIYRFNSKTDKPVIIDCGANIGLSTIYFKKLYPNANITAFEPDEKAYMALKKNIESLKLTDVTLVKKGLGAIETNMSFYSEGADGGRVALHTDKKSLTTIKITTLGPLLQRHVDFLKIDIEGSEIDVIRECKDFLKNVDNIFIEYHSIIAKPQQLQFILTTLTDAGFRYYIERTGVKSDKPFITRNKHLDYDLQLNISAIKI